MSSPLPNQLGFLKGSGLYVAFELFRIAVCGVLYLARQDTCFRGWTNLTRFGPKTGANVASEGGSMLNAERIPEMIMKREFSARAFPGQIL